MTGVAKYKAIKNKILIKVIYILIGLHEIFPKVYTILVIGRLNILAQILELPRVTLYVLMSLKKF